MTKHCDNNMYTLTTKQIIFTRTTALYFHREMTLFFFFVLVANIEVNPELNPFLGPINVALCPELLSLKSVQHGECDVSIIVIMLRCLIIGVCLHCSVIDKTQNKVQQFEDKVSFQSNVSYLYKSLRMMLINHIKTSVSHYTIYSSLHVRFFLLVFVGNLTILI